MNIQRILILSAVALTGMVAGYWLLNPPQAKASPTPQIEQAAPAPQSPQVEIQYVDPPAQARSRESEERYEAREHGSEREHEGHDD